MLSAITVVPVPEITSKIPQPVSRPTAGHSVNGGEVGAASKPSAAAPNTGPTARATTRLNLGFTFGRVAGLAFSFSSFSFFSFSLFLSFSFLGLDTVSGDAPALAGFTSLGV